ncbi:MAG: alpha/beta hydrolase [Eubacteriales bacterium]|nr:alpha/beta hydrolase [Eubacteriales bacterium]
MAVEFKTYIPENREIKSTVYLIGDKGDEQFSEYPERGVMLVCVSGIDWNRDLSPWEAPRAFKGEDDFSGGADQFTEILVNTVIPQAEEGLIIRDRYIAGYSLAGLFAVYAPFVTDRFNGFASVSGSMWYDGFIDFIKTHETAVPVTKAYFSLGDKEKNTRNHRMAVVEDCAAAACGLFRERGASAVFELNEGNHFKDEKLRVIKGIDFLVG